MTTRQSSPSPSTLQGTSRLTRLALVFVLSASLLVLLWWEEDRMLKELLKSTDPTSTASSDEDAWEPMSLAELTQTKKPNCTWPFVEVGNIVVEGDPYLDHLDGNRTIRRKIPKIIHLAWVSLNDKAPRQGRCLHHLQAETFDAWRKNFPHYSVYFHDDDAVDTLLQQANWPEFPHLAHIMQCCKMRGAMLVDVWRILVTYKYGGLYADMDLWPTPDFTEEIIPADVDFFTFTDGARRPSQNTFAMAPGNPVGYTTMTQILESIHNLQNIYEPPLVFATGPGLLAQGFTINFFNNSRKSGEIARNGTFVDHYGTVALKRGHVNKGAIGMITSNGMMVNATGTLADKGQVTYKAQIKADTGVLHWTQEKGRLASQQAMTCKRYLYELERRKARFPQYSTAKL